MWVLHIPLQKRARFTTPTSRYERGKSSVAAARQIRPTLTIAESRRADGKLIGRQRRERRYFRTVATHYVQEVAHSRDYCARIMDYFQSREVHTSTLVTQMEALRRELEDIQAASSDTHSPMLDMTDFESWQQRIRLYCKGKDHGYYILQSIDEGSFKMGRCRDEIATCIDGPYLGLERDRVVADLSQAEKDRLRADIRSELTKDDRESQLYDEFEHFGQHKGENIYDYHVRGDIIGFKETMLGVLLLQEIGELRIELQESNQPKQPQNSDYFKEKMLLMQAQVNGVDLDEEQLLFLAADQCDAFDFDVDEAHTTQTLFIANLSSADPVYDEAGPSYDSDTLSKAKALKEKAKSAKSITTMMMYPLNIHAKLVPKFLPTKSQVQVNIYSLVQLFLKFDQTCKKRITHTGLTKGERGFEKTKTCYLTDVILFFKIIKEHFEGIQKAVDQNAVDKKYNEIKRKNIFIENENLIAECLSKYVFYTATDSALTVSRFSDMHDAYIVAQKRIAKLKAKNSNLTQKIQKYDHDEMIKHFSKLEKHSEADPILDFKALDSQNKDLNAKVNALKDLNERFRAKNEKVKQHYKDLYDLIKLTHTKTIEKTTSLLTEIKTLKDQIKGKMKCVTMPDPMKPKVLAHASGSKPRSNTKKNRTLPAKSDKKKVKDHSRNNKSSVKQKNRVDSSISYKGTVINSNSNYVCKTCRKCLTSFNHDKCVVKSLKFVKKPLVHKVWRVKQDVNVVDLIKGNRGTNRYSISVEDMMKSSPIYLLSKASKNESWLWHRWLNYLNFSIINDLARKDLSRIEAVLCDGHLRSCSSGLEGVGGFRACSPIPSHRRHKVDIACIQETKWKGSRTREGNDYRLWYSGSKTVRNGVRVILAAGIKDKVVQVTRRGDRIMAISVVIDGETVNVVSAYAPQVELSDT
nr:integrase, catalytic region, zinc finger, CCHC-type, peptidase aspartic, catalytic [Tanacetum cinerariifolium]